MREPGAAHVVSALQDSGPAVQSAGTQPFGERYAEPEVLGLVIAFDEIDEIRGHGIVVVEPESDSDVVRGGFGSGENRDGGEERLLHRRTRQECRLDVGIRGQQLSQPVGEGFGQLVGSEDNP